MTGQVNHDYSRFFNSFRFAFILALVMKSTLLGQVGLHEIDLTQYLEDIPKFYSKITFAERGPFIEPLTPPPTGYIPNQEDYDWGHHYRLVVLEGHRDDVLYLEKIKQLKIDSRIVRVVQVDLSEMFLNGAGMGNRFVTVENVKWISKTEAVIVADYGTTTGRVKGDFNLQMATIFK